MKIRFDRSQIKNRNISIFKKFNCQLGKNVKLGETYWQNEHLDCAPFFGTDLSFILFVLQLDTLC